MESLGKQNVHIPESAAICLLQHCVQANHLVAARQLHAILSNYERYWSSKLSCQFIYAFASFGNLPESFKVYRSIAEKTTHAWTAIISVHAKGGKPDEALVLYQEMKASSFNNSSHSIVAALKACISLNAWKEGMVIHDDALRKSSAVDAFVGSALIDMYAKCGSLREAHNVFNNLSERDVVTWCTMIAAFTQHGCGVDALKLHSKMEQEGTDSNLVTLVSLLKACATVVAVNKGQLIYSKIVERGLEGNMYAANTAIDMYVQFSCMDDARKVFDMMPKRDIVSWNLMFSGYLDKVDLEELFLLFKQMQQDQIQPNELTFMSILKFNALAGNLEQGELLHTELIYKGLDTDKHIGGTLIDLYAKCGRLDAARFLFNGMSNPDLVVWSALISGYVQHGPDEEAFHLYKKMREKKTQPDKILVLCMLKACVNLNSYSLGKEIHADIVFEGLDTDFSVASAICDLYLKTATYQDAHSIFYRLPLQNVGSFNLLLAGYGDQDNGKLALEVFKKMIEVGTQPDEVSFTCVLRACSSICKLDQGEQIHNMIVERGFDSDLILGNALVDFYAKCLTLDSAIHIFRRLTVRSVISWSAMILGFAECGFVHEAVSHYCSMKRHGVAPNEITFVCILKACASQAAFERGMQVHIDLTKQGFSLDKHIGNCLLDFYSKCDRLDEACKIFDDLPERTVISWSCLIAALADNGHEESVLELFHRMEQDNVQPNEITYACVLKACSTLAALDHGRRIHEGLLRERMDPALVISNTLITMYSKCGCLDIAFDVFKKIIVRDAISWNAIIGAFADHGWHESAQHSFFMMQNEGIQPDGVTFVCLLTACSHVGLVSESFYFYNLMISCYGVKPTVEHHACMVDVLGRAGLLRDAEEYASRLPSSVSSPVWAAFLGACAMFKNMEFGRRAFENLITANRWNLTGYVLMSNIAVASQEC
ncbi:hypothetical protein KP509_06G074600 [Ceratopteris richardii]|nr:hypothetical protein KP509_06G074600 [Ceratopteris richardii]